MLNRTRTIALRDDGKTRNVVTRVVEEQETVNGKLKEMSRNFFATCLPNNDVYYFGQVPAGRFDDCVEVIETTALEAGTSRKVYCPRVGLVIDGDLQLTAIYDPD